MQHGATPDRRSDIEALRGVAVLLVVFYHLGWFGFSGGYLGVDMFFVVSGYVITRSIDAAAARGRFRVREFYLRRAWRLLPALFATVGLSAVAARWLLTEIDLRAFADQALGAVLMAANVVLWRQGGYFDAPAAMKPLLHLWSLGVEQQFYLLFPWLWVWLPAAQRRARWLWLLGGASFAISLVLAATAPDAAFYLTVARFWEFALGASVAGFAARPAPAWTPLVALAAIVLAALRPFDALPLPVELLVVCAATAALLHRPSAWLAGGSAPARLLFACGAISYSLYLVHWPLIVFFRHYALGEAPTLVEMGLLFAASLALAVVLFAAVERPLRRTPSTAHPRLAALAAAALLLLLWSGAARAQAGAAAAIDWADERRPNHGLAAECEVDGTFTPRPACSSSARPNVLIWGDSVAMQYAAGLADGLTGKGGLVQATMSTCGPVLDVAPVYSGVLGEAWARRCMAFNDAVMQWLQTQPSITHVVLSARFFHYVEPGQKLLTRNGVRPQAVAIVAPLLGATVKRLQAAGKKVVVVAPPPDEGFDVGACTERLLRGMPLGRRANCDIDRRASDALNRDVFALLRSVPAPVLWPQALLCDAQRCAVLQDGLPLYRDASHLSYRGSLLFARRFELAKKVLDAGG